MVRTSRGALVPLSRLAMLVACVSGEISARSTAPRFFASEVTSRLTQLPALILPLRAVALPTTGAFAQVSDASDHVPEETGATSMPVVFAMVA